MARAWYGYSTCTACGKRCVGSWVDTDDGRRLCWDCEDVWLAEPDAWAAAEPAAAPAVAEVVQLTLWDEPAIAGEGGDE